MLMWTSQNYVRGTILRRTNKKIWDGVESTPAHFYHSNQELHITTEPRSPPTCLVLEVLRSLLSKTKLLRGKVMKKITKLANTYKPITIYLMCSKDEFNHSSKTQNKRKNTEINKGVLKTFNKPSSLSFHTELFNWEIVSVFTREPNLFSISSRPISAG